MRRSLLAPLAGLLALQGPRAALGLAPGRSLSLRMSAVDYKVTR